MTVTSNIVSVVAGALGGAAALATILVAFGAPSQLHQLIIDNTPTKFEVQSATLKEAGFNGTVEVPGVDYIRVTVPDTDRTCSALMRYSNGHDVWTAKDDDDNFIQQKHITPEDLKRFLNC